jgi:hypothetical protein
MRWFILLLLTSGGLGASEISFEKSVRPLLKAHCFHCHGEGGRKEGGVDLRLRRFLLKETDEGPVVTPGDPARSHLLALVKSGEMPKGETRLSPQEVSLIESWIAAGAPVQRDEPESIPDIYITDEERSFWSFRPMERLEVPAGESHPVDAFIGAKLRAAGLDFLPQAEPGTLFRRLSFDLLGLPPEPEALAAFLTAWDHDPETAWSDAIDAALASPHYGERWGRHWLDAAGYADSDGHESDKPRAHAWHYRDYVIEAHRRDLPWDRFLTEQLAGDELSGVTHASATASVHREGVAAQLAATGFLRMAPDPTDEALPDPALARWPVRSATTTGTILFHMPITIGSVPSSNRFMTGKTGVRPGRGCTPCTRRRRGTRRHASSRKPRNWMRKRRRSRSGGLMKSSSNGWQRCRKRTGKRCGQRAARKRESAHPPSRNC